MSEGNSCDLIMPQPQDTHSQTRKRVDDLWLPQSPYFGYESNCEMEFMPGDLQAFPSPPSTADSFSCIGLSGFSDDSGEDRSYSPELTGVSENWPDSASETSALVVTVEGDGSQLIHIPCESPFYFSPSIQTHSFGFPLSPSGPTPYSPFTPCLSISSSSSSSSSSSRSSTILSATPKDGQSQYHGTPFLFINQMLEDDGSTQPSQKGSRGAMLFVDTNFLSPSSTNIAFPALPTAASRYLSGGTHTGSGYGSSSSPWGSERNYDGDLDVPRSAITPVSPMDFWDEEDGDPMKSHTNRGEVGACS